MKSLEGALPETGCPLCGPLVMKSLMLGTPMCPMCPGAVVGDEVPGVGTRGAYLGGGGGGPPGWTPLTPCVMLESNA